MYDFLHNTKHKPTRGMSLVEAVVAVGMATIALSAIASMTISFYRTHRYTIEQSFAINSARKGIERMVEDIREASFSDDGSFPIESMGAYELLFFSDIDRDDKIERVRFSLEDAIVYRGQAESAGDPLEYPVDDDTVQHVSDNVRNEEYGQALFRYYDESGTEILDYDNVTDVRFVTVHVIVNINPERLPQDYTLQSSATLRNLRYSNL
jgi:type II secretory pathway pseudopilin PulG